MSYWRGKRECGGKQSGSVSIKNSWIGSRCDQYGNNCDQRQIDFNNHDDKHNEHILYERLYEFPLNGTDFGITIYIVRLRVLLYLRPERDHKQVTSYSRFFKNYLLKLPKCLVVRMHDT